MPIKRREADVNTVLGARTRIGVYSHLYEPNTPNINTSHASFNSVNPLTCPLNTKLLMGQFKGILKKFYCWVLIFLSFTMAMFFKEVGNIISIDFSISSFLGWYVLITLMINEFRSILENLIEIGCPVPKILITGLEIANNKVQPNDSQSFPTEKSNPK